MRFASPRGDTILDTDDLLLHGNGLFQTLDHNIGQCRDQGQAVVRGVGDERVEHLISSGAELVVGILPLCEGKEGLNTVLEVLRQWVGVSTDITGEPIGNVHQSPAARTGNLGATSKTVKKASNKGL